MEQRADKDRLEHQDLQGHLARQVAVVPPVPTARQEELDQLVQRETLVSMVRLGQLDGLEALEARVKPDLLVSLEQLVLLVQRASLVTAGRGP